MPAENRSYHFRFWQDRFWIWGLITPIGLLCWALPIIVVAGWMGKNTDVEATILVALMIGIPSYLTGVAILYTFMEGLFTRVTFNEREIRHRTPWFFFPFILLTKKILITEIDDIAVNISYGMRTAIMLYSYKGNKVRKFYLPRFRDQPEYLAELRQINEKMEKPSDMIMPLVIPKSSEEVADDLLEIARRKTPAGRVLVIFRNWLSNFFILFTALMSGITVMQLQGSKVELLLIGICAGLFCALLGFIGSTPILGQLVFWFVGRPIITFIFFLFGLDSNGLFWNYPSFVDEILRQILPLTHLQISLTNVIFLLVMLISIINSIDVIIWRILRTIPSSQKKVD